MIISINFLIVCILAVIRVGSLFNPELSFTITNPLFKDFAHLYVGFLFGAWKYTTGDNRIFFKVAFWFISLIELFSFIVSQVLK